MKIIEFILIALCAICAVCFDYYAYITYSPTALCGIVDRVVLCILTNTMFGGLGFMLYDLRD